MNDAVREAKRDALCERMEAAMPSECDCGARDWKCIFSDRNHGSNLDGRFVMMMRVWECRNCGCEVEVMG